MSTTTGTPKSQTTERVAGAAHSLVDSAAAKAQELEKQLRTSLDSADNKISETKKTASEQVESTIKQVEEFAKKRPIAATGIAFAAGILAASILRR